MDKSDYNPTKHWSGETCMLVYGLNIVSLQFKILGFMHSPFLIVTSFINIKHVIQGKVFFSDFFFLGRNVFAASLSVIVASPNRLKINVVVYEGSLNQPLIALKSLLWDFKTLS